MHDDLKQRLRDEVDGAVGPRPPRELSDVLARGRSKRLARRLVTTMSIVVLGASVFGGYAASRSLSNNAVPQPADESEEKDPTVVDFPKLTTTFVSSKNGFSIKHPDRAAVTPAEPTDDWDPGNEDADEGVDVVETGLSAVFKGASTEVPEGSIDDWIDGITPGGCGSTRSQQSQITIDGQSGWIAECLNEINANVVAGDRVYLFTLLHDRSDARAVFDAFAATIELTPETAVDVPDPAWSVYLRRNMKTTFVSPTHGYSFKYLDRGGLEPAKEPWEPTNQRSIDVRDPSYLDQFDVVETGYGAFFKSASTEIPDGVSVDEWVDDSVAKYLPEGCEVGRTQQAQITIDGQPGRVSLDCPEEVVATVVMDGRLYLFMLAHSGGDDARAVFDAWVDTIDLTPEAAAVS